MPSSLLSIRKPSRSFQKQTKTSDDRIAVIPQKNIVPGDIILIKAGQIVPADARLVESDRLIMTETGITKAVGSVVKNADSYDARVKEPHERSNMIFAATVVVSGRGKAIVTETGKNTLIGEKESGKSTSHERTGSLKTLSTLSYIVGLVLIVAAAFLAVINILAGGFGALDGLVIALAYGAAFMSESYALFGSVSVAVGVFGSLDTSSDILHGSFIKNTSHLDDLKDVADEVKQALEIVPASSVAEVLLALGMPVASGMLKAM